MRKMVVTGVILALVLAAASFWAGTYYQSRQFRTRFQFGGVTGMSGQTRGGFGGSRPGMDNGGPGGRGMQGERLMSGRLDRVSDDQLTLTTSFGSIKVTFSDRTPIRRTQPAGAGDLRAGKQIIIQATGGQPTAKSVTVLD